MSRLSRRKSSFFSAKKLKIFNSEGSLREGLPCKFCGSRGRGTAKDTKGCHFLPQFFQVKYMKIVRVGRLMLNITGVLQLAEQLNKDKLPSNTISVAHPDEKVLNRASAEDQLLLVEVVEEYLQNPAMHGRSH